LATRAALAGSHVIVAATCRSRLAARVNPYDRIVPDSEIIMTRPCLSRRAFTLTALATASLLL